MSIGNPLERELAYYRRECNELGARLLRLQEEQSLAFREARRSRTVVKLLRELYRLGDTVRPMHDLGGLMLETVVDNALCDRAALLREEPIGSGNFLVTHAIGTQDSALETVIAVPAPPAFLYTSSRSDCGTPAEHIVEALGVPYVLWAYDRTSGYTLVLGNRQESNVRRPFEMGDREFIESALSVFLDVHYRKQAEMQLRQAKQAAEAMSLEHARFIAAVAERLQAPLRSLSALAGGLAPEDPRAADPARLRDMLDESVASLGHLLDDAVRAAKADTDDALLEVEWVPLEDLARSALRSVYPASVKFGVDLGSRLPKRRVAVCVDRRRMQGALEQLLRGTLRSTSPGRLVRLAATRCSDGAVEIVVKGGERGGLLADAAPLNGHSHDDATTVVGVDFSGLRRVVEAHGGAMRAEGRSGEAIHTIIVLPAHITRDDELSERQGEPDWRPGNHLG